MLVNKNSSSKRSKTDWKRVDRLKDDEIDYSDIPEVNARAFRNAKIWYKGKEQITLRLDADVLHYFRKGGKGYQTAINNVLRRFVELQKR